MKEIFDNKKKLLLFATLLFFFTGVVINLLPTNVKSITSGLIFALYFLVLSFIYGKEKESNLELPTILMIIYMITGYITIFNIMSGKKIIFAFVLGATGSLLAYLQKRSKSITKKIAKENTSIKEKVKNNFNDKIDIPTSKKITTYILPIIFITILEISYRICTFGTGNLLIGIKSVFITIVLTYTIYIFLLSLLRHTHRANTLFSVIFLIIYVINQMRIYYTSDTLLITDVLFLENTGEIASFMDVTLVNSILYVLAPTAIMVILFTYLLVKDKKNDIHYSKIKENILMFIPSLLILLILFIPYENKDKLLLDIFYNKKDNTDYTITASNTIYYKKYGVLSGMYGKFIEVQRLTPNNYNEEELKKELASAKEVKGNLDTPNVIVVFSESFWDVQNIKEIEFDKDVTPNFHKLSKSEKMVNMISPSYGGISANVEFEILTGGSLNYFSKGYTPYMQLFSNPKTIPSVIEEFRNNGYKTKILNSSSKVMFNCDKIYDYYKVDERNHLYDEIDLGGKYVTDAYLTDKMIEYFDNKDKEEKTFFFTITMGGHMPYYEERYDNYDIDIVKSPYNKEINGTIKSYAEGIYMADKELGRLYDYIQTLDEKTIIVFFGDHLPHLQTPSGKDALFEIGYLNYDYTLESVYRQFNTRALIASNYDMELDETKYLSPDLLLPYIMNNMNLELSSFYKWLYQTKDVLPSSNYVVSQDKNGKIYYTLALENEMKEIYDKREKVQYMLFR